MKKNVLFLSLLLGITSAWAEGNYSVTVDKGISFSLGWKTKSPTAAGSGTHFVPLNNVEPTITELEDGKQRLDFQLEDKYYYIYNASMEGKRSMKGYFCFYADQSTNKVPEFNLTAEDFGSVSPKNMITDPTVNGGSNVADIIMNINEKGYLSMQTGEERDVFALRNWQLINTSTANYYVEPDYRYTVINTEGKKDHSVISFDTLSTTWNPWVKMKAVGKGTVIVLVTYDACRTKIHTSKNGEIVTSDFCFNDQDGEWSALWPENTGVFVVTVDEPASTVVTGMKNAEGLNVLTTGANAGKPTRYAAENVDAELDVFYYIGEEGYAYSFKPENAAKVEIAYPVIGNEMTTYNGFSETGVSKAEDGTYTVVLKHGTQIVRLQDESGNSTYQVLRAKKASYQITNLTHEGEEAQPSDQLKIQYNGLYHPCNKLSGIYNMVGSIVYQGVANNNYLFGSNGQYKFAGSADAQAYTITIPADYDATANNYQYSLGAGLLRSNGFGSAYGAHRNITRETGATANLNAVVGVSYFGGLPEITIPLAKPVVLETANITFEDVELGESSFYNGADQAGLIATATDFSFMNYFDSKYSSWNGFAISCTTGNTYSGSYTDETQYNSCTGGGLGSKLFAVGYFSEYNASIDGQYPEIYATKNIKPEYAYITNTAWAFQYMTQKFDDKDWFKLIITGYTSDDKELGKVEFYLAKDGKIVNEWTKVDLSSLGVVNYLRFTMDSSDKGQYGINTPCYFALDNMQLTLTDEKPNVTGIDNIEKDNTRIPARKIYKNGELIIIRDGRHYNLIGQEL